MQISTGSFILAAAFSVPGGGVAAAVGIRSPCADSLGSDAPLRASPDLSGVLDDFPENLPSGKHPRGVFLPVLSSPLRAGDLPYT